MEKSCVHRMYIIIYIYINRYLHTHYIYIYMYIYFHVYTYSQTWQCEFSSPKFATHPELDGEDLGLVWSLICGGNYPDLEMKWMNPSFSRGPNNQHSFGDTSWIGIFGNFDKIVWVVATQRFLEFSPRKLGKWSNLTIMFFKWVETTN